MKRLMYLACLIAVACSTKSESKAIIQWSAKLEERRHSLGQIDSSVILQTISSLDGELGIFRTGTFHDTLTLDEGKLIDSALTEKRLLLDALAARTIVADQLTEELKELNLLKQAIDRKEGESAERNRLFAYFGKEVKRLDENASDVIETLSENQKRLQAQLPALQGLEEKYN